MRSDELATECINHFTKTNQGYFEIQGGNNRVFSIRDYIRSKGFKCLAVEDGICKMGKWSDEE